MDHPEARYPNRGEMTLLCVNRSWYWIVIDMLLLPSISVNAGKVWWRKGGWVVKEYLLHCLVNDSDICR
jgi:hypothetical protein